LIEPVSSLPDESLEEVVSDLLGNDRRTAGLDLKVRFDGGVAHIEGEVDSARDRDLVRELVGRLRGVNAVWERLRVAGVEPRIVDLGCGVTKQHPSNVGVDIVASEATDVIADLSAGIPLADASVDQVFAVHVLEHLIDYRPLLADCHRVLRDGGVLHVLVPWWRHVNAVADPTHLRLFDVQTFKYVCQARAGIAPWYPLLVARDDATVFADLTPVNGDQPPDPARLARFFA
jgi:SAM-dependent methyltransferase